MRARIVVTRRASRPTISHPTTSRSILVDANGNASVLDFAAHLRRTTKGVQHVEVSEYTDGGRWVQTWEWSIDTARRWKRDAAKAQVQP